MKKLLSLFVTILIVAGSTQVEASRDSTRADTTRLNTGRALPKVLEGVPGRTGLIYLPRLAVDSLSVRDSLTLLSAGKIDIDSLHIGAIVATRGVFVTSAGDVTRSTMDSLSVVDAIFSSTATFAGATIADLGTVTTADINGGTLSGVTSDGDFVVANGQGLIVGHTSQVTVSGIVAESQILGTTAGDGAFTIGRWSADTGPATQLFVKSRNATIGSNTIVGSGDFIGRIIFGVDDGTDYASQAATIEGRMDGAPGTDDTPGALVFSTTVDGAAGVTERLRVDNVGDTYTNDGTISSLSDSTAKKEMKPLAPGLNTILALKPISFKYNGKYLSAPDDNVERYGFKAQEVAAVAPEFTKMTERGVAATAKMDESGTLRPTEYEKAMGLNMVKMIPVLVNSIKDLKSIIDQMQVQIDSLKSLH